MKSSVQGVVLFLIGVYLLQVESSIQVKKFGEWERQGNMFVKCDKVSNGDNADDTASTTTPEIRCVAKGIPVRAPPPPPPPKMLTLWDMIVEYGDVRFIDEQATSSGVVEVVYMKGNDFEPLCYNPSFPLDKAGAEVFCKKLGFAKGGDVADGTDFRKDPCTTPRDPSNKLKYTAITCNTEE